LKEDFGEQKMVRTHVFYLFSEFKSGATAVERAKVSGRPSTSETDENVNRMQLGLEN
jgi:hypothetical protein